MGGRDIEYLLNLTKRREAPSQELLQVTSDVKTYPISELKVLLNSSDKSYLA